MAIDPRAPAAVRRDFHARLAAAVAPAGFTASAAGTRLTRRRGRRVERIELASSHRNQPGDVACQPALWVEDAAVAAGWRAGGLLDGPAFADAPPRNVADAAQADALLALVLDRLAFFDLLAAPRTVLAQVQRRYLPGLIDPVVIVPYLRAHLGDAAALTYARALLAARPELAPAFVAGPGRGPVTVHADHGTQLAAAVADLPRVRTPARLPSTAADAAHLRSFFGLQLRAWGEPAAAAALAHVDDATLRGLRAAQEALAEPVTESGAAVRLLLAAVDADRAPRRRVPAPLRFQYHARHRSFARS